MQNIFVKILIIVVISFFFTHAGFAMTTFGVAYPSNYTSGDHSSVMADLGINKSSQTVYWGWIEPTDNKFAYTIIDNFVAQLTNNTSAIIRLSGRDAPWATASPDYNVPNDLSIGGAYYNYIYSVVNHVNGLGNGLKVTAYEMEWEADCVTKHWAGTYAQYGEMAHTFYKAVKAANPNASVILGSANGDFNACNSFTTGALSYLSTYYPTEAFDKFDLHLYHHQRASTGYDQWTTTDDRVVYYRNLLNTYFPGKPMVTTEYGSPSPSEFDYMDTTAYYTLSTELATDLCVLAGDMKSTPLRPQGYPDHLRMFSFNLTGNDAALDQKHDRIVGKINAYKSLMAASEGMSEMYFWDLNANWGLNCSGTYMGHPVYSKMGLHYTINGGSFIRRDSYNHFKKFISAVGSSITSASKIDVSGYPNIYLYDVIKINNNRVKVIWENRNLFTGEDSTATPVTISVGSWTAVSVEDLFGNTQTPNVVNGNITINVKDAPIFVSEIADIIPPSISSIQAGNITSSSATITWTTNEPTDGQAEFGTTTCPCVNKTPVVPDMLTAHTISLSGLLPATTYYYRVSSKDASGNLRTSSTYSFKTADNVPPAIVLTVPQSGATIIGTPIIIVSASDNVMMSKVEFYRDADILIGVDSYVPYSLLWNSKTASNGEHALFAKAYDKAGNSAVSSSVTITVNNVSDTVKPTVSISKPYKNSIVGGQVTVTASAYDNGGIERVAFFADGATTPFATDTLTPFIATLNTVGFADGAHIVSAIAYDGAGNGTASLPVSFTIDNTPPTIALTAPADNATVTGYVSLTAAASDAYGISRVEFWRDGTVRLGTDYVAPHIMTVNTLYLAVGQHTFFAKAYDKAGNVFATQHVTVTVHR